MKTFQLGKWGSQILPLTARHAGIAPRQIAQIYSPRWQSTVVQPRLKKDGTPYKKRARRTTVDTTNNSSTLSSIENPATVPSPVGAKPPEPSSSLAPTAQPTSNIGEHEDRILPDDRTPLLSSLAGGLSSVASTPPPPSPPPPQFPPLLIGSHERYRLRPADWASHSQTARSSILQDKPSASTLRKPSIYSATSSDPATPLESLPSPPITAARSSAKLNALRSRLNLPSRFPIETLARTLVDKSADTNRLFNNYSLSVLGNDLLGYYMGEYLVCQYPRLPIPVLHAAQLAYVGPEALAYLARDWGLEVAAEPGGEVNPGLLQFKRIAPGMPFNTYGATQLRLEADAERPAEHRAQSHKNPDQPLDPKRLVTTLEQATGTFVKAVFGALYMHSGAEATYSFFRSHILSRRLDIASLFTFTQPTRDLSRLCAREGFESPVARIISETGRKSRVPVFVVGVFSGNWKMGEAAGSSLNEARFKASVHALKGYYLYSPTGRTVNGQVLVPSMVEGDRARRHKWIPAHIDHGEVVV